MISDSLPMKSQANECILCCMQSPAERVKAKMKFQLSATGKPNVMEYDDYYLLNHANC